MVIAVDPAGHEKRCGFREKAERPVGLFGAAPGTGRFHALSPGGGFGDGGQNHVGGGSLGSGAGSSGRDGEIPGRGQGGGALSRGPGGIADRFDPARPVDSGVDRRRGPGGPGGGPRADPSPRGPLARIPGRGRKIDGRGRRPRPGVGGGLPNLRGPGVAEPGRGTVDRFGPGPGHAAGQRRAIFRGGDSRRGRPRSRNAGGRGGPSPIFGIDDPKRIGPNGGDPLWVPPGDVGPPGAPGVAGVGGGIRPGAGRSLGRSHGGPPVRSAAPGGNRRRERGSLSGIVGGDSATHFVPGKEGGRRPGHALPRHSTDGRGRGDLGSLSGLPAAIGAGVRSLVGPGRGSGGPGRTGIAWLDPGFRWEALADGHRLRPVGGTGPGGQNPRRSGIAGALPGRGERRGGFGRGAVPGGPGRPGAVRRATPRRTDGRRPPGGRRLGRRERGPVGGDSGRGGRPRARTRAGRVDAGASAVGAVVRRRGLPGFLDGTVLDPGGGGARGAAGGLVGRRPGGGDPRGRGAPPGRGNVFNGIEPAGQNLDPAG